MESKIRIKMGEVEVEYEGSQEFLKAELPAILDAVSKLYESRGSGHTPPLQPLNGAKNGGTRNQGASTTTTVASKLSAKSGADLIMAAGAKLALVDGHGEFTRDQLHGEMKSARGFYKATYTNNFGNYLERLLKGGRLHEVSKDRFSLPQEVRAELEKQLA